MEPALSVIKTVCLPDDYKSERFQTATEKPKDAPNSSVVPRHKTVSVRLFLTAYNAFLALGWGWITLSIIMECYKKGFWEGLGHAFENFSKSVFILQAVLVVDIMNLLLGIFPFAFSSSLICRICSNPSFWVLSHSLLQSSQEKPHPCLNLAVHP